MPALRAPSTRDRILDAVDRLLGSSGNAKSTLDDIALESGVGRRAIHLHCASKQEIALASIDRVVERLCGRLDLLAASRGRTRAKR